MAEPFLYSRWRQTANPSAGDGARDQKVAIFDNFHLIACKSAGLTVGRGQKPREHDLMSADI
jgi:hypothetical protein